MQAMVPTLHAKSPAADVNRLAGADGRAHGYLTSTLELRSGLEIRALPVAALPKELQSEFLRMQQSWERGAF